MLCNCTDLLVCPLSRLFSRLSNNSPRLPWTILCSRARLCAYRQNRENCKVGKTCLFGVKHPTIAFPPTSACGTRQHVSPSPLRSQVCPRSCVAHVVLMVCAHMADATADSSTPSQCLRCCLVLALLVCFWWAQFVGICCGLVCGTSCGSDTLNTLAGILWHTLAFHSIVRPAAYWARRRGWVAVEAAACLLVRTALSQSTFWIRARMCVG